MDTMKYTLETLFEQLGLPSDEAGMTRFETDHGPIPADVEMADAPFWSVSQAHFLREAIVRDSPWAIPVDELDAMLRQD